MDKIIREAWSTEPKWVWSQMYEVLQKGEGGGNAMKCYNVPEIASDVRRSQAVSQEVVKIYMCWESKRYA